MDSLLRESTLRYDGDTPSSSAFGDATNAGNPHDPVTLVIAMHNAIEHCEQRCLTSTALWLSELLLAASPALLKEAIYPLVPLEVLEGQSKTLAFFGKALFSNREFTRCYDSLKGAIPSSGSTAAASLAATGPRQHTTGRSVSSIRPCEWADEGSESQQQHEHSFLSGTPRHQLSFPQRGNTTTNQWRGPSRTAEDFAAPGGCSPVMSGPMPPPPPLRPSGHGIAPSSEPAFKSPLLCFLSLYALFMEGQQAKAVAPNSSRSIANANLRTLKLLLSSSLEYYGNDAYMLWLHGVVLRELGMKQEAAQQLLLAVRHNPYLWCAWQDLSTLMTRETQLADITVVLRGLLRPDTLLMYRMFAASVRSDLGLYHASGNDWESLLQSFPTSSFIKTNMGNVFYTRKDFEKARSVFEDVRHHDPYRLEGLDEYSNVLFVRGDRVALSVLAQQVFAIDPYRAESNCVVGNYYAIIGRHEKSLLYFRRAVNIDPKYLSAWTLMGHAYLEIKNTSAAVEAYRAAVEIDQRDYRAWYGLGQIYELLQMHHHALYYYWHTTTLRPTDPRMWTAVANCLEHDHRPNEAVVCLERAEAHEPSTGEYYSSLVRRIAEHHLNTNNRDRAIVYLEKLTNCDRRKREDLLFALPHLLDSHMQTIYMDLEIPSRSPSFDPNLQAGFARMGSNPQPPRASVENRRKNAAEKLDWCEHYVVALVEALPVGDTAQEAKLQQYVAQVQSDILFVRSFLSTQPTS